MPYSPRPAGQPRDPQWFRNLVAHPDVTVEVGTSTVKARARVADAEERDQDLGDAEGTHVPISQNMRRPPRLA